MPPKDVNALANALDLLIKNKPLRMRRGKAGRLFVEEYYDWEFCVDKMDQLYDRIMTNST